MSLYHEDRVKQQKLSTKKGAPAPMIVPNDVLWENVMKQEVLDTYDKLKELYLAKNHDYGDSFSESCDEWGIVAALVRMGDKMNRLKSLYKNNGEAKVNESMHETASDLANYAIMLAAYLKVHKDVRSK